MADTSHKLTPQEERLIACAASGEDWEPEPEGDEKPDLDPANVEKWAANRTLRAKVIRYLASGETWPGQKKPWPVGPKGIQIEGARITGDLDFEGVAIACRFGLFGCAVAGSVTLRDAKTRTISFGGSHLAQGCTADRLQVEGSLFFSDGFIAKGEVRLVGVTIVGVLSCINGRIENPDGTALNANAITVGADVFLHDGFVAKGEVNFTGAKIGGQFSCANSTLYNPNKFALFASAITVGAGMYLNYGFRANGAVDLRGAKIKGQLACSKGRFENPGGVALCAGAITVEGDVFLRDGFAATGEVIFACASIKGALICQMASFDNPRGGAINLTMAEIGTGLFLNSLTHGESLPGVGGWLVLDQATCRTFCDDETSWPEKGKLVLDGFTYQRFHDCATDWQTRLKWLERQPAGHLKMRFHPQPWTQAAKVLREMGHDRDAKELGLRREIARAKSAGLRWHEKFWLGFLRITIGNGYKPHWALWWSLGFFAVGWLTFATAANLGFMAPRDGTVLTYLAENTKHHLPPQYPRFNAPLYAFDAFLPVIELGQDTAWVPSNVQTGTRRHTTDGWGNETMRLMLGHDWSVQATAQPVTIGNGFWDWWAALTARTFRNGFHRFIYWFCDVAGWILVSLYIAGMSGVVKRDK